MSNNKATNALISKIYFDPKTGLVGSSKLYEKARKIKPSITQKQVKDWYNENIQRFGNKTQKHDLFRIVSTNPNSWQIDLTFIRDQILFTAININSRIGYAQLLPDKKADSVLKALQDLITIHIVDTITTDNGKEFLNSTIQKFTKDKNITHYNNEAGDHATMGKIERFNRTIRQKLLRIPKTRKLTRILVNDLIANYNDTEHRGINNNKPNEMKGQVDEEGIEHNQDLAQELSIDFTKNDSVRYRIKKSLFGKESYSWSDTVYEVIGIDGYRVQIRSKNNQTLFKSPNELKKVSAKPTDAALNDNQTWEAERILKHEKLRNGKYRYLVKWKGYPENEATWEPQDNLRLINKNKMSSLETKYFSELT